MSESILRNRNIVVAGRRTSMKLEPAMWDALHEICTRERVSLHEICTTVAQRHGRSSLTAAMRAFILGYFRSAATADGHACAGHGAYPAMPPLPIGKLPLESLGEARKLRS